MCDGNDLPAEELVIEGAGGCDIRRCELGPAWSAGGVACGLHRASGAITGVIDSWLRPANRTRLSVLGLTSSVGGASSELTWMNRSATVQSCSAALSTRVM